MTTVDWDEIFDEAEAPEEPASPGWHLVEIETCEWTKSSTKKDMFKFRARIIKGADKSKALFGQIVISDNTFARKIAVRHLKALGLGRAQLTTMTPSEQVEHVVGTRALFETEIDSDYDPENPRASVKDIKEAPEGQAASSKKDDAPAPPKKPKATKPADDEDDVPAPPKRNAPPKAPFEEDDED